MVVACLGAFVEVVPEDLALFSGHVYRDIRSDESRAHEMAELAVPCLDPRRPAQQASEQRVVRGRLIHSNALLAVREGAAGADVMLQSGRDEEVDAGRQGVAVFVLPFVQVIIIIDTQ